MQCACHRRIMRKRYVCLIDGYQHRTIFVELNIADGIKSNQRWHKNVTVCVCVKMNDIAIITPPIKTTHGIYFRNTRPTDYYHKNPFAMAVLFVSVRTN